MCRRDVRAMVIASKCAASITTVLVSADISVVAPPITPARPIGPGPVGDHQVVGVQRADRVVEGHQRLASAALRTTIDPSSRSAS